MWSLIANTDDFAAERTVLDLVLTAAPASASGTVCCFSSLPKREQEVAVTMMLQQLVEARYPGSVKDRNQLIEAAAGYLLRSNQQLAAAQLQALCNLYQMTTE